MPDWHLDRIDSKGRWLLPWAVFAVTLGAIFSWLYTGQIVHGLGRPVVSALPLCLANGVSLERSSTAIIRIDNSKDIHVGDQVIVFSMPILEAGEGPKITDEKWRRRVHQRLRTELQKRAGLAAIVVEVAPDVPWEVVAAVCAGAQWGSDARQYLVVQPE